MCRFVYCWCWTNTPGIVGFFLVSLMLKNLHFLKIRSLFMWTLWCNCSGFRVVKDCSTRKGRVILLVFYHVLFYWFLPRQAFPDHGLIRARPFGISSYFINRHDIKHNANALMWKLWQLAFYWLWYSEGGLCVCMTVVLLHCHQKLALDESCRGNGWIFPRMRSCSFWQRRLAC